jgi:hypothetical protein
MSGSSVVVEGRRGGRAGSRGQTGWSGWEGPGAKYVSNIVTKTPVPSGKRGPMGRPVEGPDPRSNRPGNGKVRGSSCRIWPWKAPGVALERLRRFGRVIRRLDLRGALKSILGDFAIRCLDPSWGGLARGIGRSRGWDRGSRSRRSCRGGPSRSTGSRSRGC